jgi:NDP-sugar pyrophosphorylase family protein
MGIYVYEPRALAALPEGLCQFPDLVLRLLKQGESIAAFETDAAWHHIGTFEQHVEATRLLGGAPGED